jgi:hypothetical protein
VTLVPDPIAAVTQLVALRPDAVPDGKSAAVFHVEDVWALTHDGDPRLWM